MTEVRDPLEALVVHLKDVAAIAQIVGSRVYGMELPEAQARHMPRSALVLTPSGGVPHPRTLTLELQSFRVDAWCYGATLDESGKLARTVRAAMKAIDRIVVGGTLLHSALPAGGMLHQRDPDTRWPRAFESYSILAAEPQAS